MDASAAQLLYLARGSVQELIHLGGSFLRQDEKTRLGEFRLAPLREAGVQEGDMVSIGDYELEWQN